MSVTTNVYIDGFNLYYGALKKRPQAKWLDLVGFSRGLLPQGHSLGRVYYFTARVTGTPEPGAPTRQDKFLRAISTFPEVSIVYGNFKKREGSYPLVKNPGKLARVIRTEEKGSDVNVATYLLRDAHIEACDAAVVVSDDFDLLSPLRFASSEFGLSKVIVASPRCRNHLARKSKADMYRPVKESLLKPNQMPNPVPSPEGPIHRPADWQ